MNSYIKVGGIIGGGTIGVLTAGMIVAVILRSDLSWLLGLALFIFIVAGAVALIQNHSRR